MVLERDDLVSFLIKKGANANAVDIKKDTPLTLAASKGNLEIIRIELNKIFWLCFCEGNLMLVNLLLQNGANVDLPRGDNLNALMLAAKKGTSKELIISFHSIDQCLDSFRFQGNCEFAHSERCQCWLLEWSQWRNGIDHCC